MVDTTVAPATPAPAAVVAPAPTTSAQNAGVSPDAEASMQDIFADIDAQGAAGVGRPEPDDVLVPLDDPATPPAPDAAAADAGYVQDTDGNWHRPDGTFADAEEVAAITDVLAGKDGKPVTPAAPDAAAPEVAAASTAEPIKTTQPIGEVGVFDADGEEFEGIPNVSVTYKANGKTLEKVPLDKLIRKAQLGEYNEQRENEALQVRHEAEQIRSTVAQKDQTIQELSAWFERVMQGDDALVIAARQNFAVSNSPEARAQAAEAALAAERSNQQRQTDVARSVQFVAQEIGPRMDALAAQFPQLDKEVLLGRLAILTAPLRVNGAVPQGRLPQVVQIIEQSLTPWAENKAQSLRTVESEAVRDANRKVTSAQIQAALAKKQAARVLSTRNGTASPLREPPKPVAPPKTASEAQDQLLASIDEYARTGA